MEFLFKLFVNLKFINPGNSQNLAVAEIKAGVQGLAAEYSTGFKKITFQYSIQKK